MINKYQFSVQNTKKVLHKHGKQWIIVSAALLMMFGIGSVSTCISHADSTQNNQTKTVRVIPNNNQQQSNTITNQAKNLHSQILNKASQQIPAQNNQQLKNSQALVPRTDNAASATTENYQPVQVNNGASKLVNLQKLYTLYENLVASGIFNSDNSSNNTPIQPSDNNNNQPVQPSDNSNTPTVPSDNQPSNQNSKYLAASSDTVNFYPSDFQEGTSDYHPHFQPGFTTYNDKSDAFLDSPYNIMGTASVKGFNFDHLTSDTHHDDGWFFSDALSNTPGKSYNYKQELQNFLNAINQPSNNNTPVVPNNNQSDNNQAHIVTTGNWDGVNVNYWSNDTMELTGNGTIKASDAPQQLPFNSDHDDWTLKINQSDAHVTPVSGKNLFEGPGDPGSPMYYSTELYPTKIWGRFRTMNLSGLDTSNISDMSSMFKGDDDLQSLDLSNFNTSDVSDMSSMFQSDPSLQSLNLSNFDTITNVDDMSDMFKNDSNLQSLTLPNHFTDTFYESNLNGLFSGDNDLPSSDIPSDVPNSDLPSDDQSSDNGQPSDTDNPAQQMKEQTLSDINNDRAQYNLAPLQETSDMDSVAQDRANQTASMGYLQHYDNSGNMYETDDANQLGINLGTYWGENLASAGLGNMTMTGDPNSFDNQNGNDMADMDNDDMYNHDQDSGWGHRYNILGSNFTTVGIGVAQGSNGTYYLAEDFGN